MLKSLIATFGSGLALAALALTGAEAADAIPGKEIFLKNKCQQCHTIQAIGIAKEEGAEEEEEEAVEGEEKIEPGDLSGVGKEHTAEWIIRWEKKLEKKKGRKHKKKWKGSESDLKVMADWLATLKHDVPKK